MQKITKQFMSGFLATSMIASTIANHAVTAIAKPEQISFSYKEITLYKGTQYETTGWDITGIEGYSDGDTIVIPNELTDNMGNTKNVIALGTGENLQGIFKETDVEDVSVNLGSNIIYLYADTFSDAHGITSVDTSNNKYFSVDENALYFGNQQLIRYLNPVKQSFTVPDNIKTVTNMDNTEFDTLNLNNVAMIWDNALYGADIDTLVINDAVSQRSNQYEILNGAFVNNFESNSSTYDVYANGDVLAHDNMLVKVAADADLSNFDFSQFTSASPYAFNSIEQMDKLRGTNGFDEMIKGTVFTFYRSATTGTNGSFYVNGQTGFCYEFGKNDPKEVGNSVEYTENIDSENYNKVAALLYFGAPNNGTGLFEECFGMSYDEVANSEETQRYGNAAINVTSALLYEIVSRDALENAGVSDAMIEQVQGIGGHKVFTEENVSKYIDALKEIINNAKDFTIPELVTDNGDNNFTIPIGLDWDWSDDENAFVCKPFIIKSDMDYLMTVENADDNTKKIKVRIASEEETDPLYDGNNNNTADLSDTFKTNTQVVLVSEGLPESVTFKYKLPELVFYNTESNVQNVVALEVHENEFNFKTNSHIYVQKLDKESKECVEDAVLGILDEDGNILSFWKSEDQFPGHLLDLADGNYTLREYSAPQGYLKADDISFTVKNGKLVDGDNITHNRYEVITMYDEKGNDTNDIYISKQDIASRSELPGAKLTVTDNDGETVDSWTSTKKPHKISVSDGTYVLTENVAPDNYEIAENIEFEVKDGHVASVNGNNKDTDEYTDHVESDDIDTLIMYDELLPEEGKEFKISKQDMTTKKELPGATLQILDTDENVIEEWESTEEPHVVVDLEDGDYILREITAPKGFVVAEDIEFTVTDHMVEGGKIVMEDAHEKEEEPEPTLTEEPEEVVIKISKQDITNKKELKGAELIVEDTDGEVIDNWISTDTPHEIYDIEDGKYILTEITAPEGFEIAESIKFEVKDGKLVGKEMVVMYDKHKETPVTPEPTTPDEPKETVIKISKQDITNKEELEGAKLVVKDEYGDVVDEWISTKTPHNIYDLDDGKYTLTEITAPDGYEVAETINFTVKNGKVNSNDTVIMYDAPIKTTTPSEIPKVIISKQDMTTKTELPSAHLEIRKEDGELFEAWVSTDEPHVIENMPDGKYTLIEITAPKGYKVAESITFEVVNHVVANGKVVMYDEPKGSSGTHGGYSGYNTPNNDTPEITTTTEEPTPTPVTEITTTDTPVEPVTPDVPSETTIITRLPKTSDFSSFYSLYMCLAFAGLILLNKDWLIDKAKKIIEA